MTIADSVDRQTHRRLSTAPQGNRRLVVALDDIIRVDDLGSAAQFAQAIDHRAQLRLPPEEQELSLGMATQRQVRAANDCGGSVISAHRIQSQDRSEEHTSELQSRETLV